MCFIILVLLIHSFGFSTHTLNEIIQPGRIYEGGTRVTSPWSGLSFVVPEGYMAQYDEEVAGLIMQRNDGAVLLGAWGVSEATVTELGDAVIEAVQEQGIIILSREVGQPDEQTLHAQFNTFSEIGAGVLVGTVKRGEAGNAIAVAAHGNEAEGKEMQAVLSTLMESLRWSKPEAANWKSLLIGKSFESSNVYSNMISDIDGSNSSYASESTAYLGFCNAELYVFNWDSDVYFSTPETTASNEKNKSHQGRWWLVADLAGQTLLVLESTAGLEYQWILEEEGDGLNINQVYYSRSEESSCD